MPFYTYNCKNCNIEHEEFIHSPKNYVLRTKCPNCGKHKLIRDYSDNYVGIKGEPRTVGDLAERNTKKLGSYHKDRQEESDARLQRPLPKKLRDLGAERIQPQKLSKSERQKLNKLGKATDEQKVKYVMENKLP